MSNSDRTEALREFFRLSARDQSAIAKHLSEEDRKRLLALKQRDSTHGSHGSRDPNGPDWSLHSSWLAKHLTRLVADAEARKSRLTPATQAALHACLSQSHSRSGR